MCKKKKEYMKYTKKYLPIIQKFNVKVIFFRIKKENIVIKNGEF